MRLELNRFTPSRLFGVNARASAETERLFTLQSPPRKLCVDEESLDSPGWYALVLPLPKVSRICVEISTFIISIARLIMRDFFSLRNCDKYIQPEPFSLDKSYFSKYYTILQKRQWEVEISWLIFPTMFFSKSSKNIQRMTVIGSRPNFVGRREKSLKKSRRNVFFSFRRF